MIGGNLHRFRIAQPFNKIFQGRCECLACSSAPRHLTSGDRFICAAARYCSERAKQKTAQVDPFGDIHEHREYPTTILERPCPDPVTTAPVPTSLGPCWFHTPLLRIHTHAAPIPPLSPYPPTRAVFPSADNATETPCLEDGPTARCADPFGALLDQLRVRGRCACPGRKSEQQRAKGTPVKPHHHVPSSVDGQKVSVVPC